MNYYVTGDIHGNFENYLFATRNLSPGDTVILLGDSGLNFYLNIEDMVLKNQINESGFITYCIRGNHDARPQNIDSMNKIYKKDIQNYVYMENEFPNIFYLIDGLTYKFNEYTALILGGAYSIDKWYRVMRNWTWYEDEQLSPEEMTQIEKDCSGKNFDFVLSHTCPLSWQPQDLFLSSVKQLEVDNRMETWMENFKDKINWKYWLFGHYHDDRVIRPHVKLFYYNCESLEEIVKTWNKYDKTGHIFDKKDPKFFD